MQYAFAFTVLLLLFSIYLHIAPSMRRSRLREIALGFIARVAEPDIDEGLIAAGSNLGVLRSSEFIGEIDDERSAVFLIASRFYRGNCREHSRMYLVAVCQKERKVVQCVSVEGAEDAKVWEP